MFYHTCMHLCIMYAYMDTITVTRVVDEIILTMTKQNCMHDVSNSTASIYIGIYTHHIDIRIHRHDED